MATNALTASTRTEFGKGASRRLRRDGGTPAVLYGHGTDPVHLALPGKETFLLLRQANVLIELTVDEANRPVMALPRQVTRDPLTGFLVHVDLILVKKGEKVTVEVGLVLTGEAERGALVNQDLVTLTVLAPATDIPEEIEVSVEGLVIGDQILAGELKLPEGVELLQDPEHLVINVTPPPTVDLETPGEGEEGEEGEEVEGEDAEEGDDEDSE